MRPALPLAKFPVLSTKSVDEAEAHLARSLAASRILQVADRSHFGLRMNATGLHDSSLVFNRYETRSDVETTPDDGSLYCCFGSEAATSFTTSGKSVTASSSHCALPRPRRRRLIERSHGSELLVLRVPQGKLAAQLEAITGSHHPGHLEFDSSTSTVEGPGAALRRMVSYVATEIDANASAPVSSALFRAFEQMLLTACLALPHNKSGALRSGRHHEIAPGIVRRAEEYMRAHLAQPISIADVLEVCGCSRSTLFSAFGSSRGQTPMGFLTEQRLQCAREALRNRQQGTTVRAVASACGFRHLGRFARIYARRFGERPSDTLRRAGE